MYLNERKPKPARRFLSVALAVGLVAALPGAAVAAPASKAHEPRAKSAGGDVPPVIPSIVRVRIARGTKALERAGDFVDRDLPDRAVASLLNARRNMYAAWRGARYVIEHPPAPPVAEDASVHKRKARASGAPVGAGTIYASPEDTGMAVLGYQHTVATAAFALLDGAKGALRDSVSTTMFAALDRRDSSIAYIHLLPAPDPEAELPEGAVTWDTLIPGMMPDLDDELQQTAGLLNGGALTPGEKRIMGQASAQVQSTEQTINAYWPPVVDD